METWPILLHPQMSSLIKTNCVGVYVCVFYMRSTSYIPNLYDDSN